MADNPNPHGKKSILQMIKDNSFLLGVTIALATSGYTAWNDVTGTANAAGAGVTDNTESIDDIRDKLELRSSKFLTDREFADIWESMEAWAESVEENENSIDLIETRFNELTLSDERINAKIELEAERLRREIQEGNIAQNTLLQSILREVKGN